MSRPLRIEYPGAWYHVLNRGRRRENIFSDRSDYEYFLSLLMETSEMWRIHVAAYCLMPNHYHLLVQTPDGNISRSMRHLNGLYTQKYNRRHGHDGPLFRGRYKSILVSDDVYLLQLVRYIHRNPVKAGLAREMQKHPWSSYKGYLSDSAKWDWLYKDFIFSMVTPSEREKRRAFIAFMQEEDAEEIITTFTRKNLPSIIGPDSFVQKIKDKFYHEKRHYEVPASKQLAPTPDEIINVVCDYYTVGFDDLMITRRGCFNKPRNVAIYLLRHMRGDDLNGIKERFCARSYSTVSSILQKMSRLKQTDQTIRKDISAIKEMLKESNLSDA